MGLDGIPRHYAGFQDAPAEEVTPAPKSSDSRVKSSAGSGSSTGGEVETFLAEVKKGGGDSDCVCGTFSLFGWWKNLAPGLKPSLRTTHTIYQSCRHLFPNNAPSAHYRRRWRGPPVPPTLPTVRPKLPFKRLCRPCVDISPVDRDG